MRTLDELAEFSRQLLDLLRQPLEDGGIRLRRCRVSNDYPYAITLIGATNPCPCGWLGDPEHICHCSPSQRRRYWQRLSGPLLDRLGLKLRLDRLSIRAMQYCLGHGQDIAQNPWLNPAVIATARQRMLQRNPDQSANRNLKSRALGEVGAITPSAMKLWEEVVRQRGLTTRSGLQLLRVSRKLSPTFKTALRSMTAPLLKPAASAVTTFYEPLIERQRRRYKCRYGQGSSFHKPAA